MTICLRVAWSGDSAQVDTDQHCTANSFGYLATVICYTFLSNLPTPRHTHNSVAHHSLVDHYHDLVKHKKNQKRNDLNVQ